MAWHRTTPQRFRSLCDRGDRWVMSSLEVAVQWKLSGGVENRSFGGPGLAANTPATIQQVQRQRPVLCSNHYNEPHPGWEKLEKEHCGCATV